MTERMERILCEVKLFKNDFLTGYVGRNCLSCVLFFLCVRIVLRFLWHRGLMWNSFSTFLKGASSRAIVREKPQKFSSEWNGMRENFPKPSDLPNLRLSRTICMLFTQNYFKLLGTYFFKQEDRDICMLFTQIAFKFLGTYFFKQADRN